MNRVRVLRHHFHEIQIGDLVASLRIYPENIKEAMVLIHSTNAEHKGTILENIIVYLEYNEGIALFRNREVWLKDFVMEVWGKTVVEHSALVNGDVSKDMPF